MGTNQHTEEGAGSREPVALRRALMDASAEIAELERRYFALEEIHDGLEARAHDLASRSAAAEEDREGLLARVESKSKQVQEIDDEIANVEDEVVVLEKQAMVSARRLRTLSEESRMLKRQLRECVAQADDAAAVLQGVHDTVLEMDEKFGAASAADKDRHDQGR